jgi:beta-barrel assembly-enhancing protease
MLSDAEVNAYVAQLGQRIAAPSGRTGQWTFRVVDIGDINAFAIPGGHIYINRGLIDRTRNSAELAGVLGHEIGHVVLRHSAEQLGKKRTGNIVVTLVCSFTSFCASDAARIAINVGGAAIFSRYSRQDELEADSAGIELVTRAGIDPRGIPTLFEVLLEERKRDPAALETWFGSHPLEETRIRRAEELIARVQLPSELVRDDASFDAVQRRLDALPAPREPGR